MIFIRLFTSSLWSAYISFAQQVEQYLPYSKQRLDPLSCIQPTRDQSSVYVYMSTSLSVMYSLHTAYRNLCLKSLLPPVKMSPDASRNLCWLPASPSSHAIWSCEQHLMRDEGSLDDANPGHTPPSSNHLPNFQGLARLSRHPSNLVAQTT